MLKSNLGTLLISCESIRLQSVYLYKSGLMAGTKVDNVIEANMH